MSYNFEFKLVEEKDLLLLYKWFKQPHVSKWWPTPEEKEDFFESFLKRIRSDIRKCYIVFCDNAPIGYLQLYSVDYENEKWCSWLPKFPGEKKVIGIDQFIGESDYLHKGFGTLFIKQFLVELFEKERDLVVVVDPEPENLAAIKCYEKVGFEKIGEFKAPWGPALVMAYKLK